MWFRWMMLAFAFNGVSTFGLRILAGRGLTGKYISTYLVLWYLAGTMLLGAMYFQRRMRTRRSDLAVGSALGLASVAGQTSLGMALSGGIPGSIVYPVTLAGGLFIVVGAGVLLFKERVGPAGMAGIALGIISIALLSL
jgi:multidrug transporter EmrE-like cation transporter